MENDEIPSTWGDQISLTNNNNNSLRIGLQNVNGLGYGKENIWKSEEAKDFIGKYDIDIMMMTEVNVNWKLVQRRNSLQFLAKTWFENSITAVSYNQRAKRAPIYLPGGTAQIVQGETASRNMGSSVDDKKLGRWVSTKLRGKNERILRVVTVYVPCMSTVHGDKKVYCQQQKELLAMGIKSSVMTTFWKDFWKQVDKWIDDGENLVIGGDWNVDVRKESVRKPFEDRNLIPAVTTKHGMEGPETYNRGSSPIDEIFVSSSIDVTAAGYLEHGEGLGDHRPIWIEVTKESAFGAKLPPLPSFSARRLKCKDPRIVNRYNKLLEQSLSEQNAFVRMNNLFHTFSEPMTPAQIEEYEKLDKIREAAMIYAEKHCRKFYTGGIKWCPKLTRQRARIDYLRSCISKKRGTKINARTLIRKSKKAMIDASTFTLDELLKALDNEFKQYKALKSNHVEERQSYLENLAEALAAQGKGKKASHLKNLIRIEEQRFIFKKLKNISGKNNNLGTTFVTTKDDQGNPKDIIEKEEMERAIINENIKKYHQTEKTCPFIFDPQLKNDFGDMGNGPGTKALFSNNYKIPANVDKYTRAYLETCIHKDEHYPATFERTAEKYKQSWEKMDERISSRRLHFGHFKAACKNTSIIDLHYKMAEIPFRTGYSPNRWRNATNVMILKKAGLYDIDRLRTIVLYEADFNHNNKYFGRQMMHHTIDQGMLAKEQYSIPGKKAVDHALNRRLIFDIVRYKKTSLAMTSCDLKSCYDRIAHTPAYLAMVGYKYLPTPLLSMFSCIQNMIWVTRTAYGDSEIKFGGFDEDFWFKPQGVGQGNGSGPSVWAVVSSRMFEVLHNQGLSTTFTPPISATNPLDICGFAFVDDSDIIASGEGRNDPIATIKNMQETIDWWEGVAKTTGGALEPSKSWWYLLHYEWNEDGTWKYGDLPRDCTNLTARDKNNERVELKYIPVSETQTMLGVDLAPNGENRSQVALLRKKTTAMGERIRTGSLTYSEAWIALCTMAMKTIEYPLPASTLSEDELQSIMWPVLKTYLPKAGINRNISRDVLYGTSKIGGLGLRNPFITQGIEHVIDIADHVWKNTLTGKLIQNCLEHLRLEIGSNIAILSSPIDRFQPILLTHSWIRHTWEFLSKYNITINLEIAPFTMRRQNDCSLMERILQNGQLSNATKRNANKCRIFLKALTVADIASGDGKKISDFAMKGYQNDRQTRFNYDWPLWGKPSKKDWKAWHDAIRMTFCTEKDGTLDIPLGDWIEQIPEHWEWYENMFDNDLYQKKDDNTWRRYSPSSTMTRRKKFQIFGSSINVLPANAILIPTTVTTGIDFYQGEGICTVRPQYKREPDIIQGNIPWLRNSITQTTEIDNLMNAIRDGTAIAVSDGSYCPERRIGTAAWTLETQADDDTQYIRGLSISPGPANVQNAYRSELLGLLGILDILNILCKHYSITSGHITIACDGKSALTQVQRNEETISCKMKQADLISACVRLRTRLPLEITFEHVLGHQDDKKGIEELTLLEHANMRMDIAAKDHLRYFWKTYDLSHFALAPLHPLAIPMIQHIDTAIVSEGSTALHDSISGNLLHAYWIHKGRYTSDDIQNICWEAYEHAMRNSSLTRRRFVSKWSSEFIGVGKNMKRWGLRPHGNCPFCLCENETTTHVVSCQHSDATTAWDKAMTNWIKHLFKLGLDITMLQEIRIAFQNWRLDTPTIFSTDDDQIDQLLSSQQQLGWKQFMEGLLTKQWFQYLYKANDCNRSRTITNLSRIIRANWDFLFAIWTERNSKLHDTERILDFEGRPQLLEAIEKEWQIGLSRLPHNDFGYLFTTRKDTLLAKSLDSLKDWLAIIRRGRELHGDPRLVNDEFSNRGALRTWLGLSEPHTV